MALMDWLQNKVWPAEAGLKDGDCYWGTQLGILEMLKGGTTSFADMYFLKTKRPKPSRNRASVPASPAA